MNPQTPGPPDFRFSLPSHLDRLFLKGCIPTEPVFLSRLFD
jgi:hypothetical protein